MMMMIKLIMMNDDYCEDGDECDCDCDIAPGCDDDCDVYDL